MMMICLTSIPIEISIINWQAFHSLADSLVNTMSLYFLTEADLSTTLAYRFGLLNDSAKGIGLIWQLTKRFRHLNKSYLATD